jgi:predicted kinase
MTGKLSLTKPTFITLYGFPGAGKSAFARQLCEAVNAAHIQGDRIRHELFEEPRFDRQENEIVAHLMDYMTEEFLRAGISVVYDMSASRFSERHAMRDMARKFRAQPILIWFQIDVESAYLRVAKRDRRKTDDKYSPPLDRSTFESMISSMQNPAPTEDYIVISGKHNFLTQKNAVLKKFYDLGLLDSASTTFNIAKPGLVNLVPKPNAGRVDNSRRNIVIR